MDIEGYELDALPEWIESGALEKVFYCQQPYFGSVSSDSIRDEISISLFLERASSCQEPDFWFCFKLTLFLRWTSWLWSFTWGRYTSKRSEIKL